VEELLPGAPGGDPMEQEESHGDPILMID